MSDASLKPPTRPFFDRFNALVDGGLMAQLSPTALCILICYLRHADKQGIARPGCARLAKAIGHVGPRHVRRARAELVAKGFLECVRKGGRADGDTSHFQIHIPPNTVERESRPGAEVALGQKSPADGGSNSPSDRGRNSPLKGADRRSTEKVLAKNEPEGFTRFWELWPRHMRRVNRVGCLQHWKAANLEASVETIVSSLVASKQSHDWQKQDGQFIPMPMTWLRQCRWADTPGANRNGDESEGCMPETFRRAPYSRDIADLIQDPTSWEVA